MLAFMHTEKAAKLKPVKPIAVKRKHCIVNEGFKLAMVALRFGSVDYAVNRTAIPRSSYA